MSQNIAVGIDVGTYQVKVVVAELARGSEKTLPRIIGVGIAESKGLRHGYVTNTEEVARSIRTAAAQASKSSGVEIKRVFLSVGGIGLSSTIGQGSIVVSRADSEVTDDDVQNVHEICESDLPQSQTLNKKIIHSIPLAYKIDGKTVLGRPSGMKGMKFEARVLFITCLEQHLNDLIQAVADAGFEVEDVMASPLASSLVTLTKAQKIAGCVLTNIGAETVSIAVFENNIPISLEVFPIGSTDITHDIALGLKVPLEEAEKIKIGSYSETSFSKKKFEEIVEARLGDIFELIEDHLKKIGRSELLPAGIILTGGGANVTGTEDVARTTLKLPSKIAYLAAESTLKNPVRDSMWLVAYGLCILGFTQENEPSAIGQGIKSLIKKVVSWIKHLLP